jgi:lipopolysaccharide transport system ATP-binding protein
MESVAISVQNVSKKFRLFNSPRERLLEALHPFNKKYHKEFWALKDINFEVKRGQTLGIIGRNGSGKSTLLQIICSVLKPTTGEVSANGRISALLALGAGFNPEFTGRQNALLNGALMGLSADEMKRCLPEIELFADIGEFIDQPMKIYSSGMALRLAFACAVNVDPDILVIDEALAVGDAKFQYKCFQKFREFQEVGKTIIFVSHNTDAVLRYCDYAILLEKGEVIEIGEPKLITNYYLDILFTGKISNYQLSPFLAEEDFKGFNIVHYKTRYYALSRSLGTVDLMRLTENEIKEFVSSGKCITSSSFEELKSFLTEAVHTSNNEEELSSAKANETTKGELERFLGEVPMEDNCIHRNSYNKNEYRIGDRCAEIIDYLIVSNANANITADPVAVKSGGWVDIYSKVIFHKHVSRPIFSFGIRTVDGIILYADNSWFSQIPVQAAEKNEVVIFKFSVKLNLIGGDYFIGLDCSERVEYAINHIDRRSGIAHLKIEENEIFGGLVKLETVFKEVARRKVSEVFR